MTDNTRTLPIDLSQTELIGFCRKNHIRKFAFFGSVLREDFSPDSDVDVIIEFDPGHVPGLIGLAGLELELSSLMGNRKIDLNTPGFFKPSDQKQILEEALVIYDEG